MMLKRALIAVLVLVVAVFLYIGYSGYDAGRNSTIGVSAASRSKSADEPVSGISAESASPAASTLPSSATTGRSSDTTGADGQTPGGVSAPATDTLKANPPNGMTFGGSGHFQLYRQGDLTWRLNTDTGDSCVLFATQEEWRKPQVYQSGCRHRS